MLTFLFFIIGMVVGVKLCVVINPANIMSIFFFRLFALAFSGLVGGLLFSTLGLRVLLHFLS